MSDIRAEWAETMRDRADTIQQQKTREQEERDEARKKEAADLEAFTTYLSNKLEGETE